MKSLTSSAGVACPSREIPCSPALSGGGRPLAVSLRFPVAPELRIRRLISRSAPRPVFKVPSVRLGRSVHCESQLEAELAELFDACPGLEFFGEQGAEIRYELGGETHRHIPDYYLKARNKRAFVEAKFNKTLTETEHRRTTLLRSALAPLGYDYFLVTESHTRQGAYLANARFLLRRGRMAVPESFTTLLCSHLRHHRMELGEVLGSPNLAHIAALALRGVISLPMREAFVATTPIVLGDGEGMPWAWALLS